MIPIFEGENAFKRIKENSLRRDDKSKSSEVVSKIIRMVREDGDDALKKMERQFGNDISGPILIPDAEIEGSISRVSRNNKAVIDIAAANIKLFANEIMKSIRPVSIKHDGWSVGLEYRPVERVGCYVPGGRFPLASSALMTVIPARVAGVEEISVASPNLSDEVVYAGKMAGAKRFYRMGGAQAIAAFAFGTKTVKPVDMIVGPGNAYVTEAKRQLAGRIGIDMIAGPSEVAIVADNGARAAYIASDILAQAEHDPEASCWLITISAGLARDVGVELKNIMDKNGAPDFVIDSMQRQSIFLLSTIDECISVANLLAPEHLELMVKDPASVVKKLTNYGAIFVGYDSCAPFGDYMAGPNHTLPTGRNARFSEGLNPRNFLRAQSWFRSDGDITGIARDTAQFAKMEGLSLHALAAELRK